MAINDLLQNRFTRIIGTLAALAVPVGLACEADEGTTNNYYSGSSGSNSSGSVNPLCLDYYSLQKSCCDTGKVEDGVIPAEKQCSIFNPSSPNYMPKNDYYTECTEAFQDPTEADKAQKNLALYKSGCCNLVSVNGGAYQCVDDHRIDLY